MVKKRIAMIAFLCTFLLAGTAAFASEGTECVCVQGETEGILSLGGSVQQEQVRKKARTIAVGSDEAGDGEILNAIENLETKVSVAGLGITKDNVTERINRIWNLNPQLFYLQKWEYTYYPSSGEVKELTFAYTGTADEISRQQEELREALKEAGEMVQGEDMAEEEAALALHDYLAAHVRYAYDDYLEGTVCPSAYTVYGALVEGKAVCQGYALAYEYLLDQYGITSGIASSDGADHAWNIVKIREHWYHVDATWDDPPYDNLGQALHDAFLICTDEILSLDPVRQDYRVLSAAAYPYEESSDTSFAGAFWKNSDAAMCYYHGYWYYADRKTFEVIRYAYTTEQKEAVAKIENRWPDGEDPACFLEENFCRLARMGETLYYSEPSAIYAYPLDGGESYVAFLPDTSAGYLYGLGIQDGKLSYVLKTEAGQDEPENILKAERLNGAPVSSEEPVKPPAVPTTDSSPAENERGDTVTEEGDDKKTTLLVAQQSIRTLKSRKRRCLTVTWKKDKKADGYEICYSVSKAFPRKKTRVVTIRKSKTNKCTIRKLRSKKKYYVRVRAYRKVGTVRLYGKYSKRKAVKIK